MARTWKRRGRFGRSNESAHSTASNLWYWLKELFRLSPVYPVLYFMGIPLSVGISLLGVYMPSVLVRDITEGRGVETMLWHLAFLGGGIVGLYVLNCWLEWARVIKGNRLRFKSLEHLHQGALRAGYEKIERAEFPTEMGQLQSQHMWEETFTKLFMEAFLKVGTAAAGMLLYLGMLSGLSLWILLPVIAGTAFHFKVGEYCNKKDAENRKACWILDNKTSYLSRALSSYEASKDVHVYQMSGWLRKLYDRELKERIHRTVRQQSFYFLQGTAGFSSQMVYSACTYLYLIWLVCEGRLDAAGAILYLNIIMGFASWCESIIFGMMELHKKALQVDDDRQFMEKLQFDSEEADREELILPAGHIPEITFDHVTFCYKTSKEPVIRDLSLTLRPGENIALVGLNGAGKTTFIKLLCGFYDPSEGQIRIDGVDRCRYSRSSWLRCLSGVFQDTGLFPMTLLENLVAGGEADSARLKESLRMADLEEKIAGLPKGLLTMYGRGVYEDAVEMSGGEEQRMMLVRALVKPAPVLVLDEPTAALDPLTESQLYERYRELSQDKTTIFISHRLASTRFCDRIFLLENGQVTEDGTHEELLQKDGRYAWMFHLQSRYYQKREAGIAAGLDEAEQEMEV